MKIIFCFLCLRLCHSNCFNGHVVYIQVITTSTTTTILPPTTTKSTNKIPTTQSAKPKHFSSNHFLSANNLTKQSFTTAKHSQAASAVPSIQNDIHSLPSFGAMPVDTVNSLTSSINVNICSLWQLYINQPTNRLLAFCLYLYLTNLFPSISLLKWFFLY